MPIPSNIIAQYHSNAAFEKCQTVAIRVAAGAMSATLPNDQELEKRKIYGLRALTVGKDENGNDLLGSANAFLRLMTSNNVEIIDCPIAVLQPTHETYTRIFCDGFSALKSKINLSEAVQSEKVILLTFFYI